jgi:hypothetical protein
MTMTDDRNLRMPAARGRVSTVAQLLDYGRFIDQPKLAILLPELSRRDLLDFLDTNSIAVIAPRPDGLFDIVAPTRWPKAA